ncbi:hypothetical protein LQV63_26055 [Paenibacillus profundus]|uniref:Fe/B12 periplasmic-binding domain-containing protein n=1 Tax=Paenibacillus profundus TaxID=1173085 RepID=A0ABS8YLL4_9BACL|nr:hypothetical protein [Paenibacillus profundus]MCE5172738.1 hypothetical protein [Paenibacillus profundus]
MKKHAVKTFLLSAIMTPLLPSACAQSAQAEGTEPIDSAAAADHVWKTEAEPEKVIAVGQTTAELLVEFGLEDKVVGVGYLEQVFSKYAAAFIHPELYGGNE